MQYIPARWADLYKAQNILQFQQNLEKEAVLQRTAFPVSRLNNKTKIATFPELQTSRRIFNWVIYLKSKIIKDIKPDNLSKEKLQKMTVYVNEHINLNVPNVL